jgi:sterol desaturase/sphingolipid hydroxylase (fatty acid hydroxylase superfamily)
VPIAEARAAGATRQGVLLDLAGLGLSVGAGSQVVAPISARAVGALWPSGHGAVDLPPVLCFLIGFVALDYLQYGTHRLFHGRLLFRFHLAHHTLPGLNGIGAFRHSLWECVLSPSFWVCGAVGHVLSRPAPLFVALWTGFLLDVWRHSRLRTRAGGGPASLLKAILITPEEHAVHHVEPAIPGNYGANLKVWDRLHGTYVPAGPPGAVYGVPTRDGPLLLLLGAPRANPTGT